MDIIELLLIVVGLAVAGGGVVMLLRGAKLPSSANSVPRPYVPMGVIAAGLVITYLAFSDYRTMDGQEVIGLFLFGLAFAGALAIKVFITDKFDPGHTDQHPQESNIEE